MEKLKIPDTAHCKPWLGTLQKGVYTFGLKKKEYSASRYSIFKVKTKQKKKQTK